MVLYYCPDTFLIAEGIYFNDPFSIASAQLFDLTRGPAAVLIAFVSLWRILVAWEVTEKWTSEIEPSLFKQPTNIFTSHFIFRLGHVAALFCAIKVLNLKWACRYLINGGEVARQKIRKLAITLHEKLPNAWFIFLYYIHEQANMSPWGLVIAPLNPRWPCNIS